MTVDLDQDGSKEYITGKRYLAHLGKDPGSSDPATLFYVKNMSRPDGKVNLETYIIDDDSGSGTQIWIADINKDSRPDILVSNKKGTHLFLQNR